MADSAMSLERAPALIRRIAYRAADGEGLLGRIADAARFRFSTEDIPDLPTVGDERIRVVLGPANSAGQGFQWARAIDRYVPDATALSMHGIAAGNFDALVDLRVPVAVYQRASSWHAEFEDFLAAHSHVIWESGLPLLGRRYASSVARELEVLGARGVERALLFHGSDVRPTVLHAAQHPWSPHGQVETPHLEEIAQRNLALAAASGVPVFVSTPDLLQWIPDALWAPVVVDPAAWSSDQARREETGPLVVAHAPSDRWLKGTEFIEPMLHGLAADGVIDYRPISGIAHRDMPAFYSAADVVLDQFGIGSYGVGAVEAMAAGKLVMGHVDDFTREQVSQRTGLAVPIHEATPDSLEPALRLAAKDLGAFESTRAAGPDFVSAVHDGRVAASAMMPFLGVSD